jgi:hypothetical protein
MGDPSIKNNDLPEGELKEKKGLGGFGSYY